MLIRRKTPTDKPNTNKFLFLSRFVGGRLSGQNKRFACAGPSDPFQRTVLSELSELTNSLGAQPSLVRSDVSLLPAMQKLQQQLEFLAVQEEYIKDEQRNLKKEFLHAQEEVKRIQSVPLVIGQFLEAVDQNTGIVGSTTGLSRGLEDGSESSRSKCGIMYFL